MAVVWLEYHFLPVFDIYTVYGVGNLTTHEVVVSIAVGYLSMLYACEGYGLCCPLRSAAKHIDAA